MRAATILSGLSLAAVALAMLPNTPGGYNSFWEGDGRMREGLENLGPSITEKGSENPPKNPSRKASGSSIAHLTRNFTNSHMPALVKSLNPYAQEFHKVWETVAHNPPKLDDWRRFEVAACMKEKAVTFTWEIFSNSRTTVYGQNSKWVQVHSNSGFYIPKGDNLTYCLVPKILFTGLGLPFPTCYDKEPAFRFTAPICLHIKQRACLEAEPVVLPVIGVFDDAINSDEKISLHVFTHKIKDGRYLERLVKVPTSELSVQMKITQEHYSQSEVLQRQEPLEPVCWNLLEKTPALQGEYEKEEYEQYRQSVANHAHYTWQLHPLAMEKIGTRRFWLAPMELHDSFNRGLAQCQYPFIARVPEGLDWLLGYSALVELGGRVTFVYFAGLSDDRHIRVWSSYFDRSNIPSRSPVLVEILLLESWTCGADRYELMRQIETAILEEAELEEEASKEWASSKKPQETLRAAKKLQALVAKCIEEAGEYVTADKIFEMVRASADKVPSEMQAFGFRSEEQEWQPE